MFVSIDILGPKNDLITSTVNAEIHFGPLLFEPQGFSHSKIRENIGQIFSSLESLPFAPKICVFKNLLGPEELILKLPQ